MTINLLRYKGFSSASNLEKAAIVLPLLIQCQRVGAYGWKKYKKYKDKKTDFKYSVKFSTTAAVTPEIQKFVFEHSQHMPLAFNASEREVYNSNKYNHFIDFIADTAGSFIEFAVDGRHFLASTQERDDDSRVADAMKGHVKTSDFVIHALSSEDMEFFQEKTRELHQKAIARYLDSTTSKNFCLYITSYGSWEESYKRPRPIETVILREGQKERIVGDIQKFLDEKARYEALGLPWRRGYLFYGPPGTGKSSIIKALASHFNRTLYYLSLQDINSDATLIKAVSKIKPDGILLLEDVDVFGAVQTRERDPGKNSERSSGLSLSALLNVLDGPATPDGLITFMTTNHRELLDPALLRKGRVDVSEEIQYPDVDQVSRLWDLFYNEPLGLKILPHNQPMAFYADLFKTNMDSSEVAREKMIDLVLAEEAPEWVTPDSILVC